MTLVTQETIAATNAKRIAYFDGLQENPLTRDDYTTESIMPADMKIGDHMMQWGCVYEVTEIKVFKKDDPDYPVYVAIGTYIGGDLSMYKYFLQDAQNGCAKSHFTSQQGNARADWLKVTLK
jgi:hypothetical protein